MKNIVLLGSTGSVGRSVLDVVRQYQDKFKIIAISSNKNVSLLAEQAEEFMPEIVALGNENSFSELRKKVGDKSRVVCGPESLEELASLEKADIIFMAISGTPALKPLIAALSAGKTVALASKEPIVSAGKIIKKIAEENSACIIPVDSEHSAIMQCLQGRKVEDVRTLYVTGSGGSLKDTDEGEFDSLSIEEILDHPKWNMGRKITVDSATLMNKGLEVIEARWLFDISPEKIKVIIHPQAIIHSMVEFLDGTITASMFCPDMKFPILKALSFPDIIESDFPRVDFSEIKNFSFSDPDMNKFPALKMAYDALYACGSVPAVLNGANEAAVNLFLDGKIKFSDIVRLVREVVACHTRISDPSLEDIINVEKWSKEEVLKFC